MSVKPLYPEYGTDAAGEDTYANVIATTSREHHNISAYCATKSAIISLDGGTTGHIFVVAGAPPVQINGISIPKGAAIQAKNAAAGNNYATLSVVVW